MGERRSDPRDLARGQNVATTRTLVHRLTRAPCEDLAFCLRDELELRNVVSSDLSDWQRKRVLDAIEAEIQGQKGTPPIDLFERFDSHCLAFT